MRREWNCPEDVPVDYYKETRKTYTDKHDEPAYDVDGEACIDGDLFVRKGVTTWPEREIKLSKQSDDWKLVIRIGNGNYTLLPYATYHGAVHAARVWAWAREVGRRQRS